MDYKASLSRVGGCSCCVGWSSSSESLMLTSLVEGPALSVFFFAAFSQARFFFLASALLFFFAPPSNRTW